MSITLFHAELSKPGGRDENQDTAKSHITAVLSQFVVADGVGRHGGGSLASKAAAEQMLDATPIPAEDALTPNDSFSSQGLLQRFEQAHRHLKQQQTQDQALAHMATTLVILMIREQQALWGHVGDSRLYLFRAGQIHHQTKDHSVPQMLVTSGDITAAEIRHHPDRNRLLRAVGDQRESLGARVHGQESLQAGDAFLLCTDGFWEYVDEEAMLTCLYQSQNPQHWLQRMEQQCLLPAVEKERLAKDLETPGNDNYTAIAIWVVEKPGAALHVNEWTDIAHGLSLLKRGVVHLFRRLKT